MTTRSRIVTLVALMGFTFAGASFFYLRDRPAVMSDGDQSVPPTGQGVAPAWNRDPYQPGNMPGSPVPGAGNSARPVAASPTTASPTTYSAAAADEPAELPPIRSGDFENTRDVATYVGGGACAECHDSVHQAFLGTTHSRSLREVDLAREPPGDEVVDPVSRRKYQLVREDDEFRHRETLAPPSGESIELADFACRYVVGSGAHAVTYLVDAGDGFLAESPVTWYASKDHWELSPGFQNYNTGFARPVYTDCLFCHAGRVEAVDGNRSHSTIHALAIDCERCHGPGSLHVSKRQGELESGAGPDRTIVNPRHLSREQGEAICAQCHLDGAAEADVRGRRLRDFQPGHWLEDYRIHYGLQVPDTSMKVVGHVEQLHLSNCYRGSESLTCSTCHDAHRVPSAEARVGYYRDKCLACHTDQPCSLPEPARLDQSPQDDCASCHMPTSPTDIIHVPATHHRIGVHISDVAVARPPAAGELVPLGDISHLPKLEQDRCLGLAYLDASLKTRSPPVSEAYRVRARDLLQDVLGRGLQDPDVQTALARIYQRENPPQAIVFAESALQSPELAVDTRTQALFALSNSYLSLRQTQLAIQPLEQLTSLRRQAGDWFLLGVCRMQAGNLEAALEAARRAAEIRPDKPNFQELLAELYRLAGQEQLADEHALRAQQLKGPAEPQSPPDAPDAAASGS